MKGRSGGRNAKTVKQHKLEGTFNTTRHDGIEHPDPPKGRPEPPRELAGHAKAEWDRMVKRLEESRTLARVDDAILFAYVQLFDAVQKDIDDCVDIEQLAQQLKGLVTKLDGESLVDAIGKIVELQKQVDRKRTKLRQGQMALKQMLVEFGMTPASRSRVKVTAEPDDDAKPKSPLAALQQQARVIRFGG